MKIPYVITNFYKLAAIVATAFVLTHTTAYANTTYDLALTYVSESGGATPVSGTGLLVLDTPIPLTGEFSFATTNDGGTDGSNSGIIESLTVNLSNGDSYGTTSSN